MGSFCYGLADKLRVVEWSKFARGLLTAVELGGYVATVLMMQLATGKWLKLGILLFAVSVTISFGKPCISQSPMRTTIRKGTGCADASVALYLCHDRFTGFVARILPSDASYSSKLFLYLLLSSISAAVCIVFVRIYRKDAENFKRVLKDLFLVSKGG